MGDGRNFAWINMMAAMGADTGAIGTGKKDDDL